MSLFPRFGAPPPAKAANAAYVSTPESIDASKVSSFCDFSSPAALAEIGKPANGNNLADHIEAIADGWTERMAICLEAGDIDEGEAEMTAGLEVGQRFVRAFIGERAA